MLPLAALAHLKALGVRAGDRVGVIGLNSDRHLEVFFAVPRVYDPLNELMPGAEVRVTGTSGSVKTATSSSKPSSARCSGLPAAARGT